MEVLDAGRAVRESFASETATPAVRGIGSLVDADRAAQTADNSDLLIGSYTADVRPRAQTRWSREALRSIPPCRRLDLLGEAERCRPQSASGRTSSDSADTESGVSRSSSQVRPGKPREPGPRSIPTRARPCSVDWADLATLIDGRHTTFAPSHRRRRHTQTSATVTVLSTSPRPSVHDHLTCRGRTPERRDPHGLAGSASEPSDSHGQDLVWERTSSVAGRSQPRRQRPWPAAGRSPARPRGRRYDLRRRSD